MDIEIGKFSERDLNCVVGDLENKNKIGTLNEKIFSLCQL